MGIFSAIGSAISSIGSAIGGAIKSVGKAICSGLGKVLAVGAGIVAGVAAAIVAGPLGIVVGPIVGLLTVHFVSKAVTALAKKLGIIQEEEKTEEIGYRVAEAEKHDDWKKRDDFPTFDEYYKYLKEKVPEVPQMTMEQKVNYQGVGITALKNEISKHEEIDLTDTFMEQAALCRMEPEQQQAVIEAFKKSGYSRVEIKQYLQGMLPENESMRIREALLVALQKQYPEKTPSELRDLLRDWKTASTDDTHRGVARMYKTELIEERQKLDRGEPMIFDDYGMDLEDKQALQRESLTQEKNSQDGFGQI